MLLLQVAGLIATGWIVWKFSVVPRLSRQPLSTIVRQALWTTLFAGLWSALITLSLYQVMSRKIRGDAIRTALRVSATAVWFAPAAILLSELSPIALGAALVLVVSATRLLYTQWRQIHPLEPPLPKAEGAMFDVQSPPLRLRDLAPGLTAAFALQLGFVSIPMRSPMLAALMFTWGVAMLTIMVEMSGVAAVRPTRSLPRAALGVILTVILAAGVTVDALSNHIRYQGGSNAGAPSRKTLVESIRAMLRKLFDEDQPEEPNGTVVKIYAPAVGDKEVTDNSFPGVILLPEKPPPAPLVVPHPSLTPGAIALEITPPMTIPFAGEYWMFRPPNVRPPPEKSYARKGNPLSLSFLTTDRIPMMMEAHQTLQHPIDLACCSAIWIEISNADRFPGTVSLELILIDHAKGQSLSLGTEDVTSKPIGYMFMKGGAPAPETLNFPVPRGAALREFNEIKVVFHRTRLRIDRSAKISIEKFSLVPR